MKYYFITYQAKRITEPGIDIWNEVIDTSPMEYIKLVEDAERNVRTAHYTNFVVINTHEITAEEYDRYKGEF